MLALKKVALTGGLSSGKSSVGRLFKDHGAYVIDTDDIAHQLIDIPSVQSQITQLLGPQVFQDGRINRKKVAQIVFNNPEKLKYLENILHPLIREEVEAKFKEISKEKKWTLFVVEIPLLFETKSEDFYDAVVAVVAPLAQCQRRYAHQHPLNASEYNKRSKRQLSQAQKAERADFVIENDQSLDHLKETFSQIYSKITQ